MAKLLEAETRDGSVVVERDVRVPTRDGGFVAADVELNGEQMAGRVTPADR